MVGFAEPLLQCILRDCVVATQRCYPIAYQPEQSYAFRVSLHGTPMYMTTSSWTSASRAPTLLCDGLV